MSDSQDNSSQVKNVLPEYKNLSNPIILFSFYLFVKEKQLESMDINKCLNHCKFRGKTLNGFLQHLRIRHYSSDFIINFVKGNYALFQRDINMWEENK